PQRRIPRRLYDHPYHRLKCFIPDRAAAVAWLDSEAGELFVVHLDPVVRPRAAQHALSPCPVRLPRGKTEDLKAVPPNQVGGPQRRGPGVCRDRLKPENRDVLRTP